MVIPVGISGKTNSFTVDSLLFKSTANDLSKLTGLNLATLQSANSGINLNALSEGQVIYLPTTVNNAFNLNLNITPSDLANLNLNTNINWVTPDIQTNVGGTGLINISLPPITLNDPILNNNTAITGATLTGIDKLSETRTSTPNQRIFDGYESMWVSQLGRYNYDGFYYYDTMTDGNTRKYYDFDGYFAKDANYTTAFKAAFIDNYNAELPTSSYLYNWLNINTNFGSAYNGLNLKDTSSQNAAINLGFTTLTALSDDELDKDFISFLPSHLSNLSDVQVEQWLAYNNLGLNSTSFICPVGFADPIIWDVNGDGFKIASVQNSKVRFDIDNDGYYEQTAWFSNGANQDAVLAMDLNGNGKVDGAWELMSEFFNAKPTTGKSYANGFDALKQFDELDKGGNKDGQISSADLVSSKLFWWRDDGDGIHELGENLSFSGSLSLYPNTVDEKYNGSTLALRTTYNGTAVGQFYFSNYTAGTAFGKDSATGLLYTLSESSKQVGVIATSSSNTLNMADKNLRAANGGAGNDLINGSASDNFIAGGTGSDTLYIDAEDKLSNINGGDGFDTLVVTQTSSVNVSMSAMGIEQVVANNGDDMIIGVGSNSVFVKAGAGKDVVMGSNANDIINGEAGDDLLMGSKGDDIVRGEAGEDTLIGGEGGDWLFGGAGNDTFVVDNTLDKVVENANEGLDEVQSSINYTLTDNVENLTLLTGALNGNGNSLNNTNLGNSANNRLEGLAGDDVLDGSAGVDTLVGGLGSDSYVVDAATDTIIENLNEGIDTVKSSVSYVLSANVETLTLTGAATHGTGNALANTIVGNSLNNSLDGYWGADTLLGGLGDDTYIVDNALDMVIENANEGIDTVQSRVTYSLSSNIENLTLVSGMNSNATGNSLNNVLTGDTYDNVLDGGVGADTLIGGMGNDTYVIDSILDVITESNYAGTDTVQSYLNYTLSSALENLTLMGSNAINGTGNDLSNSIKGNSTNNILSGLWGDDILDGGLGADTLIGGLGSDNYIVDNALDVIIEGVNEGIYDVVGSSVTYSLADNIERLNLTGSLAINGTANTLSNHLLGNVANNVLTALAGDDYLDGGAGADTLIGGLGNDIYIVDNTGDVITENTSEGTDSVEASVTHNLSTAVENLTLTGSLVINGTGNTLDNKLVGNSANNILTGAAGNDTLDGRAGPDSLIGGLGNDTYIVDNIADVITENTAEGIDCSGQVKLATFLYSSQNCFSA